MSRGAPTKLIGRMHPRDGVLSLMLHSAVAFMILVNNQCHEEKKPLIDPNTVTIVNLVALPKASGRIPDRATRAPAPAVGAPDVAAPMIERSPDAMIYETPDAPKAKGSTDRPVDDRRQALLENMRRESLVRNMDAPLGDVDRSASDPNSTLSMEEAFGGNGTGRPMDPELARYISQIRQIVIPLWTPLPKLIQENPDLVTLVHVELTADGTVIKNEVKIEKTSGNVSFDQSCLRAVVRADRLPLPPKKFTSLPYLILQLTASDAQ